jgi:hypothetical protein
LLSTPHDGGALVDMGVVGGYMPDMFLDELHVFPAIVRCAHELRDLLTPLIDSRMHEMVALNPNQATREEEDISAAVAAAAGGSPGAEVAELEGGVDAIMGNDPVTNSNTRLSKMAANRDRLGSMVAVPEGNIEAAGSAAVAATAAAAPASSGGIAGVIAAGAPISMDECVVLLNSAEESGLISSWNECRPEDKGGGGGGEGGSVAKKAPRTASVVEASLAEGE